MLSISSSLKSYTKQDTDDANDAHSLEGRGPAWSHRGVTHTYKMHKVSCPHLGLITHRPCPARAGAHQSNCPCSFSDSDLHILQADTEVGGKLVVGRAPAIPGRLSD